MKLGKRGFVGGKTHFFDVDAFEVLEDVLIVLIEIAGQLGMIEEDTNPERGNLADQFRTLKRRKGAALRTRTIASFDRRFL